MLKCAHCGKQFKYESEKRRHEQSHDPQHECDVCHKKFSFLSALRRHKKQHSRTGSVHCEECGGTFRDDTLLQRHIKYAHTGTIKCGKCNSTFNSEIALRTHSKTHKSMSERKYHCSHDGCTKSFNFSHHLKHHEHTHTNSREHFCDECGKGFIQYHQLKLHMRSHEPDSWFCCPVLGCMKKFPTEYARKRHIATHKTISDSGLSSDSNSAHDLSINNTDPLAETYTFYDETNKQDSISLFNSFSEKTIFSNTSQASNGTVSPKSENNEEDYTKTSSLIDNNSKVLNDYAKGTIKGRDSTNGNDNNNNSNGEMRCSDCACAKTCAEIENARTNCPGFIPKRVDKKKDLPELEYRSGGVIKLKETFDSDLEWIGKARVEESKRRVEVKQSAKKKDATQFVPYNSCKAVLGNCIVSGDGTISEECLCAKMAVDEQPMTAEEIEEITPLTNMPFT